MAGPQLDGMGSYLYCMGKYYRYTGDLAFIHTNWTKISQVANALMADNEPNFDKYRNSLMYEGGEGGSYANETSHNAQAILGFRTAYDLSVTRGTPVTAWPDKANALEFEFHRQFVNKQNWQWTRIPFRPMPASPLTTTLHTPEKFAEDHQHRCATTNIYSNAVPINQGKIILPESGPKTGSVNTVLYRIYLDSSQNLIVVGGNAEQDSIILTNHTDFAQTTQSFNAPSFGDLAYVHAFIQTQSSRAPDYCGSMTYTLTRTQRSGSSPTLGSKPVIHFCGT